MMKKTMIIPVFIINLVQLYAQDFRTDFIDKLDKSDTSGMIEVLRKWEQTDNKDPEFYTSYFNYYFFVSKQDVIALTTEMPEGEFLELTDSLGNTAGFMGSQIMYDSVLFQKGIEKINEGIKLFPNRLDMRFGKVYAYGEVKNWELFTSTIIETINLSAENKNNWLWTQNEKVDQGEDVLLSSIQDYQIQLYNTEDDRLLSNMREIALAILKYYPRHIESLTNVGITYVLEGELIKSLEYFHQAEKINPKDYIVLSNIAYAYKEIKDEKKAIQYYEKVVKYGDEPSKKYAKEQLKLLQE